MAYSISITNIAEEQFQPLPAREQRIIEAAIATRLQDFPTQPTRAIKKLRPNPFAEFELRVGNLRILYNVDETEVIILAIGRKVGNTLIVAGVEFHGHESDTAESSGEGSTGDTQ